MHRGVSRDRRLTSTFANTAINRGGNHAHGNSQRVQRGQALGFITPDEAGEDLFVHQWGAAADGALKEGARVSFDAEQGDKGPKAVNVREL